MNIALKWSNSIVRLDGNGQMEEIFGIIWAIAITSIALIEGESFYSNILLLTIASIH